MSKDDFKNLGSKKGPFVKSLRFDGGKTIRNVSFSKDVLSLLDIQAELEHRSRSSMVEVMVINYLEKNERKSA